MTQQLHKRAAADFDTMKKMKIAENPGSIGQVWIMMLHFQNVQWSYCSQILCFCDKPKQYKSTATERCTSQLEFTYFGVCAL